jgi:quercetin dioxygenase-like cupin family protein
MTGFCDIPINTIAFTTLVWPKLILSKMQRSQIQTAEVVVPCSDLSASLAFFTERLGFRVDLIFPADSPSTAVISAFGVRLRLQTGRVISPLQIRLNADLAQQPAPHELTGPDGIIITFVNAEPKIIVPPGTQEWIVSRSSDANTWVTGRAGMQYRDLIPGRLGGRFVASHIRIPEGGEVPDYVHFHRIRFQMIYCKAGWVRVVYEDQGPPFVMHAGDCVLQPPQIRHRVLESSAGLEVIEIGCPAIHDTVADHELSLPNGTINAGRKFGGQQFTRHVVSGAKWQTANQNNFEVCDLGISAATGNLARAHVHRARTHATRAARATHAPHGGELLFYVVLNGAITVTGESFGEHQLAEGDSCVIPSHAAFTMQALAGTALLSVTI